jgi:hypothetical protein
MMTRNTPAARIAFVAAFLVLALALAPVALAGKGTPGGGGTGTSSSGCSVSPTQLAVDQVWTTYAWGLPTNSTVNMKITFPDGATSTGPITVASNGTFTTSGNSNMSATWGFITPEQKGTYTYQFVNRIKWPAGTFTKSYALCSVVVS